MPSVKRTRLRRSGILKMFAIFSNIGTKTSGLKGRSGETATRGRVPSPAINSKCCLADQDGFAAGLLYRFLSSLGELVCVDGYGSLDLSVIQHLDEGALLAEEAKFNDLVQGKLGHILGGDYLGDAVETEDLVLHAEDVGKTTLRQPTVKGHLTTFETAHER